MARGPSRRLVLALALCGLMPGGLRSTWSAEDKGDDDKPESQAGKDKGDAGQTKADADKAANDDDDETPAQKAAARFPQPVAVGALLHRKVLQPLESQPVLGTVAAIVRKADGTLAAVIDYGGWLGFGSRRIAVPIDAMALLSPDVEILDYEPDDLDDFPTFDAAGTTPLPAASVIRVALAKPSH